MITNVRGSARTLAGMAVTAMLAIGTAATGVSPAANGLPTSDCAVAFPEADLVPGDPVTGLTVTKGTTPDGFTGQVLGVVSDGIAPGIDMIMVRLTSPEIDRVGGIWSGMSGSPVYADDGRLIGAVSYGLAVGPSTVAGVTPFEAMDDYLPAPAVRVKVNAGTARRIAARADVTAAQAAGGFAQLKMPIGVSGVGARRLQELTGRSWLPKNTYAAGVTAPGAGPGAESIVAGGNLAAGASYGDITLGGVGTATSVCGDKVVGFGHPLFFLGRTTSTLMPADAIYIQEDPTTAPFKVANIAAPVGTITDDRTAGITGTFGVLPDTIGVTSTVTFGARSRTGSTEVSVPLAAPSVTLYELIANHERVIDGMIAGSELQTWQISGHGPAGAPWTLSVTDRYAATEDITGEVPWDVADAVYLLDQLPGVSITDVTVKGRVTDDSSTYSFAKVLQRRGGVWQTVSRTNPIQGRAGRTVNLRVVLSSASGTRNVPLKVVLPAASAGSRGQLSLTGGAYLFDESEPPTTLNQALRRYRSLVRNDEIQADLFLEGPRRPFESSSVAGPADKVVKGFRNVPVRVS